MDISFLKRKDWWKKFSHSLLIDGAGKMGFGNIVKTIIDETGKKEPDIYNNVGELYIEAFQETIKSFGESFEDNNFKKVKFEIKVSGKEIKQTTVDPDFPGQHPFFAKLFDIALKQNDQFSFNDIRIDFGKKFNELRSQDKYSLADKYLNLAAKGFNTTEGKIISNLNFVFDKIFNEPLPIDDFIKLADVYVEPCVKFEKINQRENKKQKEQAIANTLSHLSENIDKCSLPIVIHGEPGHGKTSLSRFLAKSLYHYFDEKKEPVNILFYEFKELGELGSNVCSVLSCKTEFIKERSFFNNKKTVLIFDGMDERQASDGTDNNLTTFLWNLLQLSDDINKKAGSKMNIILTGRSMFFHKISSLFENEYLEYEIQNFDESRINEWIGKFNKVKNVELSLKIFKDNYLEELVKQPILLTMCALMLTDRPKLLNNDRNKNNNITRGLIYEKIIEWTYKKKWSRLNVHFRSLLIYIEDYKNLLKTIAYILFREGKEIIEVGELKEKIEAKNEDLYRLEFSRKYKSYNELEDFVRNITVTFFFKGIDKNSFSFSHKTLKDYLSVCFLFDFVFETSKKFNDKRQENNLNNMAEDIYFLLGKNPIKREDHIPFLKDIIKHRDKEARKIFKSLKPFLQNALEHKYMIQYEQKQNDNPVITEVNVLCNSLFFLTEIFASIREPNEFLKIFNARDDFMKFINFVNSVWKYEFDDKQISLSYLDLSEADLSEADLSGADLSGADLSEADLSGADLSEADLSGADLSEANLSGADLSEANLSEAYLRVADLSGANLSGADLSGAYLSRANLSGADLSEADLSGAYLSEAYLSGAYLRGAVLSGADLSEADLSVADLSVADLSGADLRKADLRGADLSEAYLREADLSEADLSEAKIDREDLNKIALDEADLIGAIIIDI